MAKRLNGCLPGDEGFKMRRKKIYNLETFFNKLNYDLIKIDGARSVLTELRNRKSVISVMSLKYAGKMLLRPPGISNFFHRDAFTKWTFFIC